MSLFRLNLRVFLTFGIFRRSEISADEVEFRRLKTGQFHSNFHINSKRSEFLTMMNSRDSVKPDLSRTPYTNVRERYFDTQSYQPQNPYDSPLPGNYYPYQPGYES